MFDPAPQALTAKADLPLALRATHPSVNGPALLRLADEIETPTLGLGFNLKRWNTQTRAGLRDRDDPHFCGTICCIGGTAEILFGMEPFTDIHDHIQLAQRLGLVHKHVRQLFYPKDAEYPGVYSVTRAQAAAVVRHLAYTGQVDWTVAEAHSA